MSLIGDHRDRRVVDALHAGLEQQRHLDHRRARRRTAARATSVSQAPTRSPTSGHSSPSSQARPPRRRTRARRPPSDRPLRRARPPRPSARRPHRAVASAAYSSCTTASVDSTGRAQPLELPPAPSTCRRPCRRSARRTAPSASRLGAALSRRQSWRGLGDGWARSASAATSGSHGGGRLGRRPPRWLGASSTAPASAAGSSGDSLRGGLLYDDSPRRARSGRPRRPAPRRSRRSRRGASSSAASAAGVPSSEAGPSATSSCRQPRSASARSPPRAHRRDATRAGSGPRPAWPTATGGGARSRSRGSCTRISSPGWTISRGLSTWCGASSEMCTSPSTPSRISTNAPNVTTFVTLPASSSPTL